MWNVPPPPPVPRGRLAECGPHLQVTVLTSQVLCSSNVALLSASLLKVKSISEKP